MSTDEKVCLLKGMLQRILTATEEVVMVREIEKSLVGEFQLDGDPIEVVLDRLRDMEQELTNELDNYEDLDDCNDPPPPLEEGDGEPTV